MFILFMIMKATEFVEKLKFVTTLKTTYLMGGFGCRLGLDWYNENYQWNKDHAAELKKKYNTNPITFGFDCVCYLKSVLFWQFEGDPSKEFGGAKYSEKTDYTIQAMLDSCPDLTDDWSKIDAGEFVWMEGHIGAYLGDGLVAEATPSWNSGAQISALGNIGQVKGYPTRTWTKHGHSKFVEFDTDQYEATVQALKAMVEKNGKLQEKLDKANAQLKNLTESLKTHEDAISEMDEELRTMQKKLEEAQSSAEKEREEKEKAVREKEEEVGAIQSELTDLIESHKRELEVISDQIDRLTEEVNTKDKTIESLKSQKGDINGDGQVNLADVIALLFTVLRKGGKK